MAKSNWDILRHQSDKESNAHRDVYADQQLDRGKNEKIHTMTGWNILAVSGGIGTAIVTYLILGMLALAAFSLGNLGNNISQSIGHNGAKTEQRAATPNMLAGNDISSVTDVLVKHDRQKGYRLVNMSGDPRTKWVKQINELPIAGNWTVLNAKLYHFTHEGKASDSSVTTVGRIKDHKGVIKPKGQKKDEGQKSNTTVSAFLLKPTAKKVMYSLLAGMCVYLLLYELGKRKLKVQNVMSDNSDINSYRGDQHIMLPEEMMRHFTPYPDAGAHSWIQPSSMISHTAISNKGLNPVMLTQFYKADVIDPKTHETIALKGEPKVDQNGYIIQKRVPMINEKFMDALFTASDVPKDKSIRKYYDPTKIPFPNKGYESDAISEMGHWKKLGVHTVADLINKDWKLPAYETQRPAGVYWMDVAPVNTMVLAITRAGKGQTYIEPLIDAWTREQRPNNIVINDPKGELLKEFYVPATYRGFQIVQFNLINSMNTDIYNPLIMASEAAREGNFKKAAQYVDSIGNVFFPKDGGDDPVWPNAANNAFKRTAFGLIDYYLEEEHELRLRARERHTDPKVLATQIDKLWGHVTLYNCYEMFVRLSSKKITNPINQYNAMNKSGELDKQIIKELADKGIIDDDPEYDQKKQDLAMKKQEIAKKQAVLWNGQPTQDELTLFFNASERLPGNSMRDLVNNANHALTAMAGADQMLASVYGIAVTAMSFFVDPTISTLTSGTPSQNVDLAGISFPRRIGFRIASKYAEDFRLTGATAVWQAYKDDTFSEKSSLGADFHYEGLIDRTNWALFYLKGIFPTNITYLKCTISNTTTGMNITSFYFKFEKTYQTSLSGMTYVTDPVLGTKIPKNGILYELRPTAKMINGKRQFAGFKEAHKQYKIKQITNIDNLSVAIVKQPVITQTLVRYSEKPKMVFLVTPPHLMSYAKIILILISQLVDLNFEQSYMTEKNQKPLYKTRFMLDELGNLQSDKHGIANFQTLLSIGLGQDQQFTLILQTLQQLKDVYGDSVDKIVQGDTSNIVFLKSTDDTMLETLSKMSGKTHRSRRDSKTITTNLQKIALRNEGKLSYTIATKEEPVITYNDMAFIGKRNSIVFRAGDSPIWNRNETVLPMSWRLLKNSITQPGHNYSLKDVPTLSSAKDFDVRKNQPDFARMLEKRIKQSLKVEDAEEAFKKAFGYDEHEIDTLDPNDYSDNIMLLINNAIKREEKPKQITNGMKYQDPSKGDDTKALINSAVENEEQKKANADESLKYEQVTEKLYAGGFLSKNDLVDHGRVNAHGLDKAVIDIYNQYRSDFERDKEHFTVTDDGTLESATGDQNFILAQKQSDLARETEAINDAAKNPKTRTYAENNTEVPRTYDVQDAFYRYLASLPSWKDLANGTFEREMAYSCRHGDDDLVHADDDE